MSTSSLLLYVWRVFGFLYCPALKESCHLVFVPGMCSMMCGAKEFSLHTVTMEQSLCVGLKYVDPHEVGQMHTIASCPRTLLKEVKKNASFNLQNVGFKALVKVWSCGFYANMGDSLK